MALFGFGKEKKDGPGSSDQILAYLEDAQRTRAAFTLVGPRKVELGGTIQSIDEAGGLISFQVPMQLAAEKGARIDFLFIQEGLRLGGASRIVDLRSNLVVIELPDTLEVKERRAYPRARLNPKESTTLTALTGLFEGVGITGAVENLSERGARIRVDKALNLKGEKRLPLGSALVPAGQPFMLIKLNKAPKCPAVMELTGRAVFLDASAGGLVMGLAFDPPKSDISSALRSLVASRTTPVPSALPPKARRKPPEATRDPQPARPVAPEAAQAPAARVDAVRAESAPGPEEPAAVAAAAPVEPPKAVPAPEPPPPKNDALTRLKKRSRAVVALAPSAAYADLLMDHLREEGYGRPLVTHSPKDLLEYLQQPNLGVLLIDGDFSSLEGLQFAANLKTSQPALPPIILAVEEVSTAIVLAARRNGISQVLVKPYALDAAFSDLLNQQMGL
jgi:CheY-like chemotaxis protein